MLLCAPAATAAPASSGGTCGHADASQRGPGARSGRRSPHPDPGPAPAPGSAGGRASAARPGPGGCLGGHAGERSREAKGPSPLPDLPPNPDLCPHPRRALLSRAGVGSSGNAVSCVARRGETRGVRAKPGSHGGPSLGSLGLGAGAGGSPGTRAKPCMMSFCLPPNCGVGVGRRCQLEGASPVREATPGEGK